MRQLFPSPVDPADVYGDPPRAGPGGRPGVRLNMIASVDGATTVAGVSGGLGDRGHRGRRPGDALARAARVAEVVVAGDRDVDLAVALDARASWTVSRSPARRPCACARSASRTGSCSCATVRGQVARLPEWTH